MSEAPGMISAGEEIIYQSPDDRGKFV